jgi:hypothetical protein
VIVTTRVLVPPGEIVAGEKAFASAVPVWLVREPFIRMLDAPWAVVIVPAPALFVTAPLKAVPGLRAMTSTSM